MYTWKDFISLLYIRIFQFYRIFPFFDIFVPTYQAFLLIIQTWAKNMHEKAVPSSKKNPQTLENSDSESRWILEVVPITK